MSPVKVNIKSLRVLSQVFTPSAFSRVVREEDYKLTEKRLKKHFIRDSFEMSYRVVLEQLYKELQEEYRSEYFFKNGLFNKFLLKKYSLSTTVVLSEFKIGNSIADFVLLNGTARIFEIKTDLDSLDKLEKQLNDYRQFADLIYIVTSSKHVERIKVDYAASTIGIIEFTKKNTFKEHKKATSNFSFFNHETIFKTLRKSEYLDIVYETFGYIPDVPNTKIFKACLNLVKQLNVENFQKLAFSKLKERKIEEPTLLKSDKTPFELKQICYTLNFSESEYNTLHTFLNKTIK
jgi:hypothetical protein